MLVLKLDKKSQRGDQRIFWLKSRNISEGGIKEYFCWNREISQRGAKGLVYFENRADIICYLFLLFSLFLNNIKISTLDAIKVVKNSLKSVQFSGYLFVNLWNCMIIITNFFPIILLFQQNFHYFRIYRDFYIKLHKLHKIHKNCLKNVQFSELSETGPRFRKVDCTSENWTVGSAVRNRAINAHRLIITDYKRAFCLCLLLLLRILCRLLNNLWIDSFEMHTFWLNF